MTFSENWKIKKAKKELLKWIQHRGYGSKEDKDSSINDAINELIKQSCQDFLSEILPEYEIYPISKDNPQYDLGKNNGYYNCRFKIRQNAEEIFKKL